MIEAGRHFKFKIQQEERIYPLCKNGVEDKIHFVMKCTQFEELRAKMLQLVENKYVTFKSLNYEQKFFIFSQMRTKKSVMAYQNLLLKDSNSTRKKSSQ